MNRHRRCGSRASKPGRLATALAALFILLPSLSVWSDQSHAGPAQPPSVRLNVAFTSSTFVDINKNDALAAIKVWAEVIGEQRGYTLRCKTMVFDDGPFLVESLMAGQLDLITLDAWLYVSLADRGLLTPVFVPAVGEEVTDEFLVLVRKDSDFTALHQLQDADLSYLLTPGRDVGRAWLEALLEEQGLPPSAQFFTSIEEVEKLSAAVLPVFFGKRSACVIDRSGFETMADLNPQLRRQLTILAQSPPFVEKVVCLRNDPFEGRADFLESLAELHIDPKGRQILMMFKIDRLVPFEQSLLDHVVDLALRQGDSVQSQSP